MWIGITAAAVIFAWYFAGLAALDMLPKNVSKLFGDSGEMEAWVIRSSAGLLIVAGIWSFRHQEHAFLNGLWPELVGIGVTVLGIDELNRRRSERQYKQQIIRQMGSFSNDFALEAARIAKEKDWLEKGTLQGRDFKRANLRKADLKRAKLQKAIFTGANLQDAIFIEAELQGARFGVAELQKAWFQGANLQGAGFVKAQLQGALLRQAKLQGAVFYEAKLQGANFTQAKIQGADFEKAEYDEITIWPEGFDPKAAGAILTDYPLRGEAYYYDDPLKPAMPPKDWHEIGDHE